MNARMPDHDAAIDPTIEAMLLQVTSGRGALPAGTVLGHYVVERALLRDDIAVVYRAIERTGGERVEIEEYLPEAVARRDDDGIVEARAPELVAAFEAGRRAFADEAKQLAQPLHPSLLRIEDSWVANGTVYRVRPVQPEATLETLRESFDGVPSESWLRALLQAVAAVLKPLHAVSIVHGNVRPGSVVIRPDGAPLLLGFDAARWALGDHATHPEPGFLAIEQTERYGVLPAGAWTDVYALGALALYAACRRAPPPAAQRGGESARLFSDAIAALQSSGPQPRFAPQLAAAIDRALAVSLHQRLRSIDELVPALGAPVATSVLRSKPSAGPVPVRIDAKPSAEPAPIRGAAEPPVAVDIALPPIVDTPRHASHRLAAAGIAGDDDGWRAQRPAAPRQRSRRGWWFAAAVPLAGIVLLAWHWDRIRHADRVLESVGSSIAGAPPIARSPGVPSVLPNLSGAPGVAQAGADAAQAMRKDATAQATARQQAAVPAGPAPRAAPGGAPGGAAATQAAVARAPALPAPAATATVGPATTTAAPATATAAPATATTASATATTAPATAAPATAAAPGPSVATGPRSTAIAQPAGTGVRAPTGAAQPAPATAAAPGPAVAAAPAAATAAPAAATPGATRPSTSASPREPPASRMADVRSAEPRRRAAASDDEPSSPREACGPRTNFSLYRCMQSQCERDRYYAHPQCIRLRLRDEVS